MAPSLSGMLLRVASLIVILWSMTVHDSTLSHPTFPTSVYIPFLPCLSHLHLHHRASPVVLMSPNPVGARNQDPPPLSSRTCQKVFVLALNHHHCIGNRSAILKKFPLTRICLPPPDPPLFLAGPCLPPPERQSGAPC